MSEKETLERIIKDARERLCEIKDAEWVEENAPLVGKCYKVRDYYACPEKPEDYWWQYMMVYALRDALITWTFSLDPYGLVRIRTANDMYSLPSSYEEITHAEFMDAWDGLLAWLGHKAFECVIQDFAQSAERKLK